MNEPRLVAGLIHHFFVELPDPILTDELLSDFFDVAGKFYFAGFYHSQQFTAIPNQKVRVCAFHSLIFRLPQVRRGN